MLKSEAAAGPNVQAFALEMHALEIRAARQKLLASVAELKRLGLESSGAVKDTDKIAGDLAVVESATWVKLGVQPD